MPEDRYVPDFSEVPPDPADPVPVDHPGAGWRPFRCVPEYVEAEPEPVPPRRYNYISVQAPRGPNDPCVISAAGREAKALPPLTDVEITAALEPLRRDIEQAGGRLEVRYEEPAPPWPERDALIARQQAEVFERLAEPRGALTVPDVAACGCLSPPWCRRRLSWSPKSRRDRPSTFFAFLRRSS